MRKEEKAKTRKIKKWDEIHGEYEVEVSEDVSGGSPEETAGAGPSISRNPISNCWEMHYELMENENHNLRNVIESLWTELGEKENQLAKKVISNFRKKTGEQFQQVDGMNAREIEEMVSYYVQA